MDYASSNPDIVYSDNEKSDIYAIQYYTSSSDPPYKGHCPNLAITHISYKRIRTSTTYCRIVYKNVFVIRTINPTVRNP